MITIISDVFETLFPRNFILKLYSDVTGSMLGFQQDHQFREYPGLSTAASIDFHWTRIRFNPSCVTLIHMFEVRLPILSFESESERITDSDGGRGSTLIKDHEAYSGT